MGKSGRVRLLAAWFVAEGSGWPTAALLPGPFCQAPAGPARKAVPSAVRRAVASVNAHLPACIAENGRLRFCQTIYGQAQTLREALNCQR